VVDAANHVIAREGLGLPRTYRESVEILVREKILPADREEAFVKMVRFRNRAVYLCDGNDPAEVFAVTERCLTARSFAEGMNGSASASSPL